MPKILEIGQLVAANDLGNWQAVNEASHLTDKQKHLIVCSQSGYNALKVTDLRNPRSHASG